MASILVIRALVGASLSIGVADVAVIDLVAAPRALAPPSRATPPSPTATPPSAATPPAPAEVAVAPAKHFDEAPSRTDTPASIAPTPLAAPSIVQPTPPARIAATATLDPPPAAAPREDRVYFAKLHGDLDDAARRRLAAIAALHPAAVAIEGHTDYRGGEALNLPLRHDRAEAARAELVRLGVAPAAITVRIAPPSPEPAAAATGDATLWRDRRVDLAVTFAQGVPIR